MQVLLVDDNPIALRALQLVLSQFREVDVAVATDGARALESVDQRRPDLIVTDIAMPVLDGYGLLEALRQRPDTASIPVVAVTSQGEDPDVRRGLQAGFVGYLAKPVSGATLAQVVVEQLGLCPSRWTASHGAGSADCF